MATSLRYSAVDIPDRVLRSRREVRSHVSEQVLPLHLVVNVAHESETTRPILEPIRSETWGIGVRKGQGELLSEVNAFLKKFREEGQFDALADRYMASEKAAFEEKGVPFIFH